MYICQFNERKTFTTLLVSVLCGKKVENEEELVKSDLICHDMRVWGAANDTRGSENKGEKSPLAVPTLVCVCVCVCVCVPVWGKGVLSGGHEGGGGCCLDAFMCSGRDQHSLGVVRREEGGTRGERQRGEGGTVEGGRNERGRTAREGKG